MLSVSIGPLALPLAPLLLLATVWLASWLAARVARRNASGGDASGRADAASHAMFMAALAGLLVARLVYVGQHASAYADTPLALLDLRDGGWHAPSGWLTAAAWLAWQGRRQPGLRRALAAGAALGVALGVLPVLVQQLHRAADLPSVVVNELQGGAPTTLATAAAGRPGVVNLWAPWCAPCRAGMPTLAAAQQREKRVGFLFVNQGEAASTVQGYLAREGLTLREVLLDAGSALGPAVGSRGLPTTLFYDAQGRQIDAHFGVLNAAALESRLQRLRPSP